MSTQIVSKEPTAAEFAAAADVLELLADDTRLRIVWALLHGEHSVNGLAEHVGAQPAAVSQHLAKLRLARLVRRRREGNRLFYAPRTNTSSGSRTRPSCRPTTSRPEQPTTEPSLRAHEPRPAPPRPRTSARP